MNYDTRGNNHGFVFPEVITEAADLWNKEYENQTNDQEIVDIYKLFIQMKEKISGPLPKNITAKGGTLVSQFLVYLCKQLKKAKKKNGVMEHQKNVIEEIHKEVTDSINYAEHLQKAILPSFELIDQYIPDNFIIFKPKDIVSGDFYWFEHINNTSYLIAADCTGHGIPGAFLSVICSHSLNRSIKEFGIVEPYEILNKTRELVIESFAKSGKEVKDGMDIALCAFDKNKVTYAGANNPLWIVRKTALLTEEQKEDKRTIIDNNYALIEYKANRQPVARYASMESFTQQEINLFKGDCLYFFTDGFADQFGGKNGKKFKYKPFKRLLIKVHTRPMSEQKVIIEKTYDRWKGKLEQIDDVCVIGVRM